MAKKRAVSRRKRSPPITTKRVKDIENAIKTVGEGNVKKPSRIVVGKTRFQSIGSFKNLTKAISSIRRGTPYRHFSYTLELDYISPSGKRTRAKIPENAALPIPKSFRQRIYRSGPKKGRKQSANQAFQIGIAKRIRARIFRKIEEDFGFISAGQIPSLARDRKQVMDRIRKFRKTLGKRADAKYRVTISREVF